MNKDELINRLGLLRRIETEYIERASVAEAIDTLISCVEYLIHNQPECSNQEDLKISDGFFLPPWNLYEHPEKTEGWLEFQTKMKENPEYYKF